MGIGTEIRTDYETEKEYAKGEKRGRGGRDQERGSQIHRARLSSTRGEMTVLIIPVSLLPLSSPVPAHRRE